MWLYLFGEVTVKKIIRSSQQANSKNYIQERNDHTQD